MSKNRSVSWDFIRQNLIFFAAHRIDFLIVGEVAIQFHVSGCCVESLSIWFRPTPENKALLVSAIRELHPRSGGRQRPISLEVSSLQAGVPYLCDVEGGSLLLVDALPGLDYDRAFQDADDLALADVSVRVLSFKDLETTLALPQVHRSLAICLDILRRDRWPPLRIPIEFFPCGMFYDAGDHASCEDWYGKHLKALGELPLHRMVEQDAEIYRLLLLPTFTRPLCVRIEHRPAETRLMAARLSGRGGYEPGVVDKKQERLVKQAEWERARQILARPALWQTPRQNSRHYTLDGTVWVLEHARPGLHRGKRESCPATTSEIQRAGRLLLELAGNGFADAELD